MKKEEQYRLMIDPYFERYFNVEREVWSTGKRRIDYVLQCKESFKLFGVEVKHLEHMRGIDIGAYIKQASDYSNHFWKTKFAIKPIKLMIFITPAISNFIKQVEPKSKLLLSPSWYHGQQQSNIKGEYYQAFHRSDHDHSNVNSMLSAFSIGEIKSINNKIKFIYSNKLIWTSCNKWSPRLHSDNFNFYQSKLTPQ